MLGDPNENNVASLKSIREKEARELEESAYINQTGFKRRKRVRLGYHAGMELIKNEAAFLVLL